MTGAFELNSSEGPISLDTKADEDHRQSRTVRPSKATSMPVRCLQAPSAAGRCIFAPWHEPSIRLVWLGIRF
jgi:hypothetical protein